MSDPANTARGGSGKYKAQDPILQLQSYLYEHNLVSNAELDAIEASVAQEVAEAVAFAEESPPCRRRRSRRRVCAARLPIFAWYR